MHMWGQEDVDWQGINDAAYYIAHWLRVWARIPVQDYKEKYGTVRVYCGFGIAGIYGLWRPSYVWYPKWWPIKLDMWLTYHTPIFNWINKLVVPLQQRAYVWRYGQAVRKWPHLYKEIVSQADYGELFEGHIPGYVHSHYWTSVSK